MAAKTRYEDGEMHGVLLPYFCGVEGMERRNEQFMLVYDQKAVFHLRNRR